MCFLYQGFVCYTAAQHGLNQHACWSRANKRLFLLDYDGTLIPCSSINSRPTAEVLAVLKALVADPRNVVYIISGRGRSELGDWFESVVRPSPANWWARGCVQAFCMHQMVALQWYGCAAAQ